MSERRGYYREYYRRNCEKLSERKQDERDSFDRATSYWRQCFVLGRDLRWLIASVPDNVIERARVDYEVLLVKEYGPAAVAKMRAVSTWERK